MAADRYKLSRSGGYIADTSRLDRVMPSPKEIIREYAAHEPPRLIGQSLSVVTIGNITLSVSEHAAIVDTKDPRLAELAKHDYNSVLEIAANGTKHNKLLLTLSQSEVAAAERFLTRLNEAMDEGGGTATIAVTNVKFTENGVVFHRFRDADIRIVPKWFAEVSHDLVRPDLEDQQVVDADLGYQHLVRTELIEKQDMLKGILQKARSPLSKDELFGLMPVPITSGELVQSLSVMVAEGHVRLNNGEFSWVRDGNHTELSPQ